MKRLALALTVCLATGLLFGGCAASGRYLSQSSALAMTAYPSQQGAVNDAVEDALRELDLKQVAGKSVYLEGMSDPVSAGMQMYPYIRDNIEVALLENGAKVLHNEVLVSGGAVIVKRPDNVDYTMYILMPKVGVNHRSSGAVLRQLIYETIVKINIKAFGKDGATLNASGEGRSEVVYGQRFLIWSLPGTTDYTETPGVTLFDAYLEQAAGRHSTPQKWEERGILQR